MPILPLNLVTAQNTALEAANWGGLQKKNTVQGARLELIFQIFQKTQDVALDVVYLCVC